ncbi:PRC-barrel domain-containing protein [Sphingomonas crusticola]|uniref:PRC-barrel domain-containing protein n=1 Tax=Sphingomonas crusticola TaxID=1697973 RepID=UPI000E235021|nr:PRC-barrel domain-containing protein [Sphingomonas crusticola]
MFALAGWIAPAATMIAAIMTAANLGTRITGWGFVVFSVGAVAWIIVGAQTGQQNLLLSNAFLLVVDVVGVWRWLGRKARYDAGATAATVQSAKAAAPTLFALTKIEGMPVRGADGEVIATAVDAMAACDGGGISYIVVSEGGVGGVGERLHALGWGEVTMHEGGMTTQLDRYRLARRPELAPGEWPPTAAAAGVA